jgi:hypothetical protein
MDRRLALPLLAQVADHRCQLVCGDAVQSAVAEAHAEVLLHGAAVAGLRRGAQVEHRAGKPQVSCLAEPEPGVGRDRLATSSTCKQFVPNLPAAMIPPSTVRQRWMPAASLKPTSSTPVGRR